MRRGGLDIDLTTRLVVKAQDGLAGGGRRALLGHSLRAFQARAHRPQVEELAEGRGPDIVGYEHPLAGSLRSDSGRELRIAWLDHISETGAEHERLVLYMDHPQDDPVRRERSRGIRVLDVHL